MAKVFRLTAMKEPIVSEEITNIIPIQRFAKCPLRKKLVEVSYCFCQGNAIEEPCEFYVKEIIDHYSWRRAKIHCSHPVWEWWNDAPVSML